MIASVHDLSSIYLDKGDLDQAEHFKQQFLFGFIHNQAKKYKPIWYT